VRVVQAARGAALTTDSSPPGRPRPDPRDGGTRAAPDRRLRVVFALVALAVLALDVATKVWVVAELEGRRTLELLGGQLLIRVSRNPGAAFSIGENATLLFTIVAVVVVVVVLRVSRRLGSTGWAVSLGLLLGGASGNLVDRLLRSPGPGRGAVVDFLDFQVWPSFNVADSAIVTGGALAVLLSLRGIEVDGTRASAPSSDA
jgi:signal peptidase II